MYKPLLLGGGESTVFITFTIHCGEVGGGGGGLFLGGGQGKQIRNESLHMITY